MSEPELIMPDWRAPANVRAFFTTRRGGVSEGVYESLNLGAHVGDDPDAVAANRQRVAGLLPKQPLWLNQQHGNRCIDANEHVANEHAESTVADACVSGDSFTPLAVAVADCLPLLLARQDGSKVAVVHAGWRGLGSGVIRNAVEALGGGELACWLGPCIRACHYEVGEEVRALFGDEGFTVSGNAYMMDIPLIATRSLQALGVDHIFDSGLCTHCEERRFFSHRRDGRCGRMAGFIWKE